MLCYECQARGFDINVRVVFLTGIHSFNWKLHILSQFSYWISSNPSRFLVGYKNIKNDFFYLGNLVYTYYSNSSNIRIVFTTNIRIPKTTIRPTLVNTVVNIPSNVNKRTLYTGTYKYYTVYKYILVKVIHSKNNILYFINNRKFHANKYTRKMFRLPKKSLRLVR